jgi:glutamate N-acetyltransferase/amino-acid N-acetyltransferase
MPIAIPKGFRFAGLHCGIKRNAAKEDLTLVVADAPAVAAGVYTQNLVCAAPVLVDRQRTPTSQIRAVVVNSGNANACTGERGMNDALEMTRLAAAACDATPEQALVMSTGIIGVHLPMEKIVTGVQQAAAQLGADEAHFLAAARGILTTDKGMKVADAAPGRKKHRHRQHGERGRHDRPEHGDDARLGAHRCRTRAGRRSENAGCRRG